LFQSDVARAKHALDTIDRKIRDDIAAAKRRGANEDEIDSIHSGWEVDWREAYEDHRLALTNSLSSEADKLMVFVPGYWEDESLWEHGQIWNKWYLNDKGINVIRSAIRQERKSRYEPRFLWASLILGIIGTLTGLANALAALAKALGWPVP